MKKIWIFLGCFLVPVLLGCDLQPKIMSLPDSVGDFISQRYPALLADPYEQPEIYNSAASDYGVYASPELYGAVTADDYVLYSSVSDYIIPPQSDDAVPVAVTSGADVGTVDVPETDDIIVVNDNVDASPDVPTDDYLMVPMYGTLSSAGAEKDQSEITVAAGDTLYSLARRYNTTTADLARINKLDAPYTLRVGQTLRIKEPTATYVATPVKEEVATPAKEVVKPVETKPAATDTVVIKNPQPTTTKVQLQEITVGQGDTLYSISRKYSVPVNDLAVMNDISAPFGLRVGQRLKVPNLASDAVRVATKVNTPATTAPKTASSSIVVQPTKTVAKAAATVSAPKVATTPKTAMNTSKSTTSKATQKDTAKTATKSNNAKKSTDTKTASKTGTKSNASTSKQPVIMARSASKFSWPVRGRVLSGYGAKSNGLFNDGINISATRGTTVSAAENGVVAYAGNEVKGMGNLVIIQHSDGWMTVYAHLDSMSVRRGTNVRVGQKIGTVGNTGKVDKPQLHFEIRKGTKAYNPTTHLKK